jgi:4-amino-4-deoxy-L-arabinose transferase-like glycosyltransferase
LRSATASRAKGWERIAVAALLVLHGALAVWGATRNSVTFDENFHVAAGVAFVTRADPWVSPLNPPLVKAMSGLGALAAGARLPADSARASGDQVVVAESFMRANADRYHRVFFGARAVVVALSLVLGWLVWRFAGRLYGGAAGLLALSFYVLAPEALAHAGLATLDLATGLGLLASVYAYQGFVRSGRWGWWWLTAAAVSYTFLTRFTALYLVPVLLTLAAVAIRRGAVRHPGRLVLGTALLVPVTLATLHAGYLGQTSFRPLREARFESRTMMRLQSRFPALRVPLPDAYLRGLDWLSLEAQAGNTPTYLLGRIHDEPVWYYFPLALAFKWPLGFIGALAARTASGWRLRPRPRRRMSGWWVGVPAAAFLASAMFLLQVNAGVRYLFPLVPFLCVWLGGLAGRSAGEKPPAKRAGPRPVARWATVGIGLAFLQCVESAAVAPWYLAFYNAPSGGPGGGDRLVNDSNVDWGQGLLALRKEMRERGIQRIALAYHGTTNPAVYGIDYDPYLGGPLEAGAEWFAVSSYYRVGLTQRMMTSQGRTDFVRFDFAALDRLAPVARPARCMYLYRLPRR